MIRTLANQAKNKIGETIKVCGWIKTYRSHGKIIFVDLRDISGVLQIVFLPDLAPDILETAKQIRTEWVVEITGVANKRPGGTENKDLSTGNIEIAAKTITVLAQSQNLPFDVTTDGREINDESRLKYRYLDLRRERLKNNLIVRQEVTHFIREFLKNRGFVEVDTPSLTRSTPEGARDFLVPSRLQPEKFYALPQSPQQYKQLLMTAGLEKYFQIAKCFRDEDPRADRQAEFTQLDLEMSFIDREDIMKINEELLIDIVRKIFPNKTIQEIPFPRLSYKEALAQYNIDRPDLREDKSDPNILAFCWVVDFPFFEKDKEGGWTFTHNPFSAPKPEFMNDLLQKKNIENILTSQYDIVLNGSEIGGGSIRNHTPDSLKAVFEIMGFKEEKIKQSFGYMLEAFDYGTPPHGGIAWGLDRLLSMLLNESNIREVIAFPKTGDSRDLMMDSPSKVDENQLEELNIRTMPLDSKTTPLKKSTRLVSKTKK